MVNNMAKSTHTVTLTESELRIAIWRYLNESEYRSVAPTTSNNLELEVSSPSVTGFGININWTLDIWY
jgi:hypothetical protein